MGQVSREDDGKPPYLMNFRFVFTDKTRLPTHKSMEKARLDTFVVGKGWIHDQVKNHAANSKMVCFKTLGWVVFSYLSRWHAQVSSIRHNKVMMISLLAYIVIPP